MNFWFLISTNISTLYLSFYIRCAIFVVLHVLGHFRFSLQTAQPLIFTLTKCPHINTHNFFEYYQSSLTKTYYFWLMNSEFQSHFRIIRSIVSLSKFTNTYQHQNQLPFLYILFLRIYLCILYYFRSISSQISDLKRHVPAFLRK